MIPTFLRALLACSIVTLSLPAPMGADDPAASGSVAGFVGCVGDCDGDDLVGISELIILVNVALGLRPRSDCAALGDNSAAGVPINVIVAAVGNALVGCPAPAGLGTRRLSLDPESSVVTAVLAPDFMPATAGFTGFLELTGGVVNPTTGIASIAVTDASEFLFAALSSEVFGLGVWCIRPDRTQFPVENAGVIFCDGGNVDFALSQDHNLGVVDTCTAPEGDGTGAGLAEGISCASDEECASGQCFSQADCLTSRGSPFEFFPPRVEGPDELHPGVCNGPLVGALPPGDADPGALSIAANPFLGTLGLPVEFVFETALPCGDEPEALGAGVIIPLALATGTGTDTIEDANNQPGLTLQRQVTAENFSCDQWTQEDGPGSLRTSSLFLDVPGSPPLDIINQFVFDDARPGCPSPLTPGDHACALEFDGETRLYDVHVPPGYDGTSPVPLVLDVHGFGVSKTSQASVSGFKQLSDDEGFIVAYPQGLFGALNNPVAPNGIFGPSWNAGELCCGAAPFTGVDDVGFARALVQVIAAEADIDLQRVYATGLSNGGAMSHRLACEAADVFAAVAPAAFPLAFAPLSNCQPSRPIAVLHFAGLTDGIVPYEGGELFPGLPPIPSAQESFTYWREVNGCGDGPPEETTAVGASFCETDTSCADEVQVGLCSITADAIAFLGHVPYANPDFAIAEVAWRFLSRFELPAP